MKELLGNVLEDILANVPKEKVDERISVSSKEI